MPADTLRFYFVLALRAPCLIWVSEAGEELKFNSKSPSNIIMFLVYGSTPMVSLLQ